MSKKDNISNTDVDIILKPITLLPTDIWAMMSIMAANDTEFSPRIAHDTIVPKTANVLQKMRSAAKLYNRVFNQTKTRGQNHKWYKIMSGDKIKGLIGVDYVRSMSVANVWFLGGDNVDYSIFEQAISLIQGRFTNVAQLQIKTDQTDEYSQNILQHLGWQRSAFDHATTKAVYQKFR